MYYNDYKETIKNYLRHRTEWTVYIENLKQDIAELEQLYNLNAAPKIPHLTFTPGAGNDSQTEQERIVERKYKAVSDIALLNDKLSEIEPTMKKMERALAALSDDDRKLVVWRWCDRHSMEEVARWLNISVRNCRYKNNEILDRLANMMWGPNSTPPDTTVVLYKINDNIT